MFPDRTRKLAATVVARLIERQLMIVTAESCTGGLIAGALTDISGSSAAVHGGFVTYANAAKVGMIGVPQDLLDRHGAVSEQVARAMAEGARRTAGVDVAIAVTGIAGPLGGSDEKPVGLVHFGCATSSGTAHMERRFDPALGRADIREATVDAALQLALENLSTTGD
jgi:nicotinamide-nucleotide amidase